MTLIHIFLFLFVLFSGLSLPIFRSWLQLILAELSRKISLGLSAFSLVFISSSLVLFLFPSALFKVSFYLSVTASLCLAFFHHSSIQVSLALYFSLFPLIVDFGAPHPSSILVNILITPLFAPILLLTCFLTVPLWMLFQTDTSFLFHSYFIFFSFINDQLSTQILSPLPSLPLSMKSLYFLCTVFLFFYFSLKDISLKKYNYSPIGTFARSQVTASPLNESPSANEKRPQTYFYTPEGSNEEGNESYRQGASSYGKI